MGFDTSLKNRFNHIAKSKDISELCSFIDTEVEVIVIKLFIRKFQISEDVIKDSIHSFLYKLMEENDHKFFIVNDPFSYFMKSVQNGILDDLALQGKNIEIEMSSLDLFIDDFIEDIEELSEDELTEKQINVLS